MNKCASGHSLEFQQTQEDWTCDACQRLYAARANSPTRYGCRLCDFDFCQKCYKKSDTKKCLGGHSLHYQQVQQYQEGKWRCDGCDGKANNARSSNPKLARCEICNYDHCENCLNIINSNTGLISLWQECFISAISFCFNVVSVSIGGAYWGDCYLAAAKYLVYAGTLGVCCSLFYAMSVFATIFCDFRNIKDSRVRKFILLIFSIVFLFRLIWGMAIIYPAYAHWDHQNVKLNDGELNLNYCHHTPFMFAFVILIIETAVWGFLASLIICCPVCALVMVTSEMDVLTCLSLTSFITQLQE